MAHKVLLLGATGESGHWILEGLLEDGGFDVTALVRKQSLEKPEVKELKEKNVAVLVGDSTMPVDELTELIRGFHTIISAIDAGSQLAQFNLVDAAAAAGIKRFVPCGFSSIIPPGGVHVLRDLKEQVYQRIFRNHLPYTIVDVGFWHVLSYPNLPSGKVKYASPFLTEQPMVYDQGTSPNLLTHAPDVGRWIARIINDERTLNKWVVAWSDELTQGQIFDIMEKASGEKLSKDNRMFPDILQSRLAELTMAYEADEDKLPWKPNVRELFVMQYLDSMFFRRDNTLENAKYLGYLDARELYPDFKPTTFAEFVEHELLPGKTVKPYAQLSG